MAVTEEQMVTLLLKVVPEKLTPAAAAGAEEKQESK
jgi:hypothetical protein